MIATVDYGAIDSSFFRSSPLRKRTRGNIGAPLCATPSCAVMTGENGYTQASRREQPANALDATSTEVASWRTISVRFVAPAKARLSIRRTRQRPRGNIAHARVDVEAADARERAERDATRRNGICRESTRDALPSLNKNGASHLSPRHRKLHRLHDGVRKKTDGIPVRRPQCKRTKQHKQQRQCSHADIIPQTH